MSMTDLLSDCLARIRNGQMARKSYVMVLKSKLVADVLNVMKEQGYVKEFEDANDTNIPCIKVYLSYYNGRPVIKLMRRVSKPGNRVYSPIRNLDKSHNGLGVKILSTPEGVLSDKQARTQNVGGEVLCEIF